MTRAELLDRAPAGVFRGRNFITPNVEGYARCRVGFGVAWVELATGPGILDPESTLYGVTFRRADGSELWREDLDPSGCFSSEAEALSRIEEYTQRRLGDKTI
jgi:hypothetical protein